MKKASQFLSEDERRTIALAVAEAERATSGEIVPVLAGASGRYDRAEDLCGVVAGLAALAFAWLLFQDIRPVSDDWAPGPAFALGLIPLLLIVAGGFAFGSAAATFLPVLRLPFVTGREMREEVERSAAEAFRRFRIRRTGAGTGILLYVSLFERMVRVLGDDAVAEKLSQQEWDSVRDLIVDGIRQNRAAEGLSQAILKCGELLSRHFPIQPGERNEITNELRIVDSP